MSPIEPLTLAPAAFVAGVLMFLAPCTLPIIPGYLIFISGTPLDEGEMRISVRRRRILLNALAFVIGFSLVFILLGTFAAALGSLLGAWRDSISRLGGLVIILFGIMMLGVVHMPFVGREWHALLPSFVSLGRWESSLLIGALFALGWSPCIGPILGTVLLFASTSATVVQGAILLSVFSLGLAVPFMLTAFLIDTAAQQFAKWGRALNVLSIIGGVLLIILGMCILLGVMGAAVSWGYSLFDLLGYNKLYNYF